MNPAHRWLVLALSVILTIPSLLAQSIFTYAGGGPIGDGGPATEAILNLPNDVAVDGAGNLYINDWRHKLIRKVDATTAVISTIAGGGTSGHLEDVAATLTEFNNVGGIAVDTSGNVFICDQLAAIYRVDAASGIVTRFAGFGTGGSLGDGGPAIDAYFNTYGFAADAAGNLLIADWFHNTLRRVDATTRIITTIAGGGSPPDGIGDGLLATEAALQDPRDVEADAAGNIYVNEFVTGRIRVIDHATNVISTWAGGGTLTPADGVDARNAAFPKDTGYWIRSIDIGADGTVYALTPAGVWRIDPETHLLSRIPNPGGMGLAVASDGSIVTANQRGHVVWSVSQPGNTATVVAGGGPPGDGRPATAVDLKDPSGLTLDSQRRMLVVEHEGNRIRRIDPTTQTITTIAGNGEDTYLGIPGPAIAASFQRPNQIVVDNSDNIYFTIQNQVLQVTASDGLITVFAGGGWPADRLGDGGPRLNARFDNLWGIARDLAGDIFVADVSTHRIRKITVSTGTVTTVVGNTPVGESGSYSGDGGAATDATLNNPFAIAFDAQQNLFIADYSNNRVRRVDAATGIITTVAGTGAWSISPVETGQLATEAIVSQPIELAFGPDGDLYVADAHCYFQIDVATGVITRVAGSGEQGFTGDGGRATAAATSWYHLGLLHSGDRVYLSDSLNTRVRVVPLCRDAEAPVLQSPAAGATGTSLAPTLTWSESAHAFSYDVLLDTSPSPTTVVAPDLASKAFLLDPVSGTMSYTLSNLQPGTTYYWKIVAKGDRFCDPQTTAESAVRSFTTVGSCTAPGSYDQSSPTAGATISATSVLLSWSAAPGAASYDVYAGTTTPPPFYSTTSSTSQNVTSLAPNTTYSWYVVAHASCDTTLTRTTGVRTFTVSGTACDVPGTFATTAPPNGQTNVATTATLQWSAATNATSYDLYFGTTSPPPLFLSGIRETSKSVEGLAGGTTYYWQVKARVACNTLLSSSTAIASFTTTGTCVVPSTPQIAFTPPGSVSIGQSYVISWSAVSGLDEAGTFVVERSLNSGFATILDTQRTRSTSASFIASTAATHYHRIRAVPYCNAANVSAWSATVAVNVTDEAPNVIFTVQPEAVLSRLGQNIEDLKTTFTVENISSSAVVVDIPRAEIGSVPFFRVIDPFGGDIVDVSLAPRTPKTFEIRFAGPSNNTAGSYQGIVYVVKKSGASLPVIPYAFVNLKVGDESGATPSFRVGGVAASYAAFPAWEGVNDSTRPPLEVEIYNPGSSPLAVGGEIGPELWLQPEAGWNANPIPAGAYRVVHLYTRRSRAPNGASFTRSTYFTVRTSDGKSARLLVQDNDPESVASGRLEALDPRARTLIVPDVRSSATAMSLLTLTNLGSDVLPVPILFTPSGSDGFSSAVRQATVILPPNDVVTLTDPLAQLFGLARPASGQIELRVAEAKLGMLMAASSLVDAASVDAQIAAIPLVARGSGARAGAPHELSGVTQTATLTSDLVLAETTGIDGAEVSVSLFNSSGALVGELRRTLLRYGQTRIEGLATILGATPLERGRLQISVVSGAGSVRGILETTDGSRIAAVASEPLVTAASAGKAAMRKSRGLPQPSQGSVATSVAVPFAATGTADNSSGSTYRTVLGLAAPWSSPASFSITFANAAGTTSAQSVNVPAGGSVEYNDVLHDLFGIVGSAKGSLRIEATPSGSIYSRLYDGVETVAAIPVIETSSEDVVSAATSMTPLHLDGLEQSIDSTRGRRWNVYLTEIAGGSGAATVRLYEAANREFPVAQKDFSIGANEQLQLESVFRAMDLETPLRSKDRTGVLCVVTPKSGSASIVATAVAIENESGAAMTYAFQPGNGLPFSTVQAVSDRPSITSFTPANGIPGTPVTINGTRFSNVIGVSFAGTAATFVLVSDSQVTTTVPENAASGKITLTSLSGPGTTAVDFIVLHAPTITGFAPASGAVGESVTITGAHLGSATAVTFNGTPANFTATGETQITAAVPEGATSGKISVTTPGGSTTSTNDFTVIPAPAITSFAPTSGPVGTSVTITGSGFTGATGVAFNGTVAQVTVDSDTQISTTVPAGATSGKIGVTTPGGAATSASDFTVIPAPAITSFAPTGGPVGTSATITGRGFTGTTSVVFNGTAAQFTVDGDTQIVTTVPAGATSGPITVTTPGGAATSAASFTVVPAPVITSFAPASGPAGTAVTINGSGFTGAAAVAFNGTAAIFVVNSDAQIAASVPAGATSGKIAVTTVAGTASSEADFVVVTPPRITSFTPTLGAAGTAVTIDGSGFSGATGIAFNGVDAWFSVVSDSRVSATVPVGATTGPLRVTTPLGTAYSENAFTVSVESVPGDANGDGEITPSDVVYLINALFGGGSSTAGSDVNGDGSVDVADVFYLINYLFAGGPPPVVP